MISMEQIAQWCAPWNHLFGHSKVVAGTVTGAHIISLMLGGGLAIAADRATLRAGRGRDDRERVDLLREIRAVHTPVLAAMVVLFASGVLLALADVETFLPSVIFWTKLALVALLLVNGSVLTITERRLNTAAATGRLTAADPSWARMRVLAWLSITLWTVTAVAGVVLSNAA